MVARLPIFPLATVLVPGLVLPLHIFEPRYRQMIEQLMALPEDDGAGDLGRLAARVTQLFAEYRRALGVEVTALPDDPQVVSYLVAAAVVLHLPQRQALLERPTTADRLQTERELLRREVALIKEFRALPGVELTKGPVSSN